MAYESLLIELANRLTSSYLHLTYDTYDTTILRVDSGGETLLSPETLCHSEGMPRQNRRIVTRCVRAVGAGVLMLFAIVGTWQVSAGSWGITAGAALAVIVLRWRREKPDAVLGVHLVLCALQLGVTDAPLPADLTIVVSLYAAGRWGERELAPVWAIAVVVGSTLGAWDWNRDELGIVPLSLWAQDMAQAAFAPLCSAASCGPAA